MEQSPRHHPSDTPQSDPRPAIASPNHRGPSRRQFLGAAALAAPALLAGTGAARAARAATTATGATGADPLPQRRLGRHGPEVTILSIGGMMKALSPEYYEFAWAMGIRYFDNADCYLNGESERILGKWLAQHPGRRKELFLVTKDHPLQGPRQLLDQIDARLAACGTDYADLFLIHGLGPKKYAKESVEWPKSREFHETCDKLKASGKAKMVGFSVHDPELIEILNNAAAGGFVDAIMLRYNPFFTKGDDLDRALDACHAKGIGLIAMKGMRALPEVPKRVPDLDRRGLTTHQAVLHAIWSDPRMSAVCSSLENIQQMEQNAAAARSYRQPLDAAGHAALREAAALGRFALCPGCPACRQAARETPFAFDDITRFVAYYEQDGTLEARDFYRALAAAHRDPTGFDLVALRDRCQFHVDYPAIVGRARRYFA